MNVVPTPSAAVVATRAPARDDAALALNAPAAHTLNNAHPLEVRTAGWDAAQLETRRQLLRRTYGAAEPIRRAVELEIVERSSFVPAALGGPSNLHRDILLNTDASLTWEDVHREERETPFAAELRQRMGL